MAKIPKPLKFKTKLETPTDSSGWHFIYVPGPKGEKFPSDGKSRRVVCTLNGKQTFQCALLPGKGDFCIVVNKKIRTALKIAAGDIVTVEISADTSKYGMEMPEELREVLAQDPEGDNLFHQLTPGRQRSLIYAVIQAKNIDRRIHTALIVLEHLKENGGRVLGEQLYEELKRPMF